MFGFIFTDTVDLYHVYHDDGIHSRYRAASIAAARAEAERDGCTDIEAVLTHLDYLEMMERER